jgi:pimeloyl-ACP methyl ester carboxylesterase
MERSGFSEAEDGTRLYWNERGEGPSVVLLDGIGCDGFVWKYLKPYLAQTHRVLHWHYRGHGRSGLPADPARIDVVAHARDMVDLLDAREIDEALVLGHSMGTQVALEAYRRAPERFRGLGLFCGSYGKVTSTFRNSDVLRQVLPAVIDVVGRRLGLARALWGRIPTGLAFHMARLSKEIDGLAMREEDFRAYMEHVASMDPQLFLAMLREAGEHTAEDLLPDVRVPTLVVAAERDTFTPPMLAEHLARTIPGAELVVLEGASHAAPIEQPENLERHLAAFLRRLGDEEPRKTPSPPP